MKGELEKRQSEVIAAMRFPLMVLLLFAHVLPMVSVPIEMNLSEMNIYHFISEGISHNLSRIRNPLFFFFSGFFFFRKLEEWNAGFYRSQLKKRIRSLLLPYLLWNILMIAAIYIKNYAVTSFLSMEPGEELSSLRATPWYILFWHTPANYPMWFLRDLLCMSVLAPLFYLFFRFLKGYGVLILVILYLSAWETDVAGLSMSAIMFFGAGAYMGIYKKNILEFCSRFRPKIKLRYAPGLFLPVGENFRLPPLQLAISYDGDHGMAVGKSVKSPGLVFLQRNVFWSFPGFHPGRGEEGWKVTV